MKKFTKIFTVIGLSLGLIVAGCTTLTPTKVKTIAVVVQQVSQQGASYAIQKDAKSATYFRVASAALDTFVIGNDLTPTAFQDALSGIQGANNQWVQLGVSAVIIAYDVSYSQYVIGQVNSNTNAVILLNAVNNGFKLALGQTNVVPLLVKGSVVPPDFLKGDKVNKELIRAKVTAARK